MFILPPQTGQPFDKPATERIGTNDLAQSSALDGYRLPQQPGSQQQSVRCEAKPGYVPVPSQFAHESSDYYDCTLYKEGHEVIQQYNAAKKSVVKIDVERDVVDQQTGVKRTLTSHGSGFFVTLDGKVATNLHVVDHANRVVVRTSDGKAYNANIVKLSQANDLAVIKVDTPNRSEMFSPLPIGESDSLKSGDSVTGFGFPRGWDRLFASPGGYSSIPGGFRSRNKMIDVARRSVDGLLPNENPNRIMLSSEILTNEGNSGGPLMHDNKVVGVMTLSNVDNLTHSTRAEDLRRLLNEIEFDQALKGNPAYIPGSTALPNSPEGRSQVRSKAAELIYNFQSLRQDQSTVKKP